MLPSTSFCVNVRTRTQNWIQFVDGVWSVHFSQISGFLGLPLVAWKSHILRSHFRSHDDHHQNIARRWQMPFNDGSIDMIIKFEKCSKSLKDLLIPIRQSKAWQELVTFPDSSVKSHFLHGWIAEKTRKSGVLQKTHHDDDDHFVLFNEKKTTLS